MKAIQITIEESILREMDKRLKGGRRRSAFIRESIRAQLDRLRIREIEEQEQKAYQRRPIRPGELDVWDRAQKWGSD